MQRNTGFSLIEMLIAIAIISILATIALPNFLQQRTRANNALAESMAKNFELCQAAHREIHGQYATHINGLVAIDKNLLDTPGLTFIWIEAKPEQYTFNVRHEYGDRWITVEP